MSQVVHTPQVLQVFQVIFSKFILLFFTHFADERMPHTRTQMMAFEVSSVVRKDEATWPADERGDK